MFDVRTFELSLPSIAGRAALNAVVGVFLFEADSSGLKAFVAAGLEVGPDVGSTSKIFTMNALGALVSLDAPAGVGDADRRRDDGAAHAGPERRGRHGCLLPPPHVSIR